MAIDWRMGVMPDVGMNAMAAFQQGRQIKEQRDAKEAMAAYAVNPNKSGLNALAQYDPKFVVETKRTQATEAKTAKTEQMQVMGRLLDQVTPETYTQALNVAQRYGIDISQAPQQYDPNWVGEMRMITRAINKDGPEALSSYGKIAMDRGLRPGTPEFATFVAKAWNADQVKTIPYAPGGGVAGYNAATGQTSTVIAPNMGGAPTGAPVGGGGNIPRVASPGDAAKLPPGSKFYDPNGVLRTVPGGGVSNGTSGFRP